MVQPDLTPPSVLQVLRQKISLARKNLGKGKECPVSVLVEYAQRELGDDRINRKLFDKLIREECSSLTFEDIDNLDRVLRSLRVRWLERASLISVMSAFETIEFFLRRYVLENRVMYSQWDVNAMSRIERLLGEYGRVVHPRIHAMDEEDDRDVQLLGGEEEKCSILLGSPRAFKAADAGLQKSLDLLKGEQPPFKFLWTRSDGSPMLLESPFNAQFSDVVNGDVRAELQKSKAWALLVNESASTEQVVLKSARTSAGTVLAHGILTASWIGRSLLICCCGSTGPLTESISRCLPQVIAMIDKPVEGENSEVVWYVIEAEIGGNGHTGEVSALDKRKITRCRVHSGPFLWANKRSSDD